MPLEIIGAGFGRTGTSSLKAALEHLGFGPCHHMYEVRDGWQPLYEFLEVEVPTFHFRIPIRQTSSSVSKHRRKAEPETAAPAASASGCQQSYSRWRNEYGGLKVDQARRPKELGRESARLVWPCLWGEALLSHIMRAVGQVHDKGRRRSGELAARRNHNLAIILGGQTQGGAPCLDMLAAE